MRVNNAFFDIQQDQRRDIVSSILHNDNNDTNVLQQPKAKLWEGSFNSPLLDQIKSIQTKNVAIQELKHDQQLDQKADEHFKNRLLSKGLNTMYANKQSSQTNRYNDNKADIHHNEKQPNEATFFNALKHHTNQGHETKGREYVADIFRENHNNKIKANVFQAIKESRQPKVGITPEQVNQQDDNFYTQSQNPSIISDNRTIAQTVTQQVKSKTKQIEDKNIENRKKLQFTSPRKLDFTPEVQSSALALFQPKTPEQSNESIQFTPLQLTETKNKLKRTITTEEAMKDMKKFIRQAELDETMTPEKSRKAVNSFERFVNNEELNANSLEIPKQEYNIKLDNLDDDVPIDLTRFQEQKPIDDKVKEANAKYEKALRQQKRMEDEQRLKARKDVLSSQQNPSLDLQGVQAEQKKKDTYFKAQINNRFSGYSKEPLKYVTENYENDFDKLKLWAEKNPNDRLGPKSNNTLWKLYIDYLYSSSISNKHPGPNIKSSTLLRQIDELKPSLQKNLKLFKPQGDAKLTAYSSRGIVTMRDLPSTPKQSNQLVMVAK